MFNHRIVLTVSLMVLVALTTVPSTQAGATLTKVNRVTFSSPVSLPGVVLLPGTYMFESGPVSTHPDIVRVTSADYRELLYVGFTRRIARPAGVARNEVVSLGEALIGAPVPITAWYPIGSNMGHGFFHR